jgi:acyl carrier protein
MDPRASIRAFIEDNFVLHGSTKPLEDATSLLDTGRVDSTGVLTLVAFIEDSFGVAVSDEDLVPDNFDSIDRIVAYIQRARALVQEAS